MKKTFVLVHLECLYLQKQVWYAKYRILWDYKYLFTWHVIHIFYTLVKRNAIPQRYNLQANYSLKQCEWSQSLGHDNRVLFLSNKKKLVNPFSPRQLSTHNFSLCVLKHIQSKIFGTELEIENWSNKAT